MIQSYSVRLESFRRFFAKAGLSETYTGQFGVQSLSLVHFSGRMHLCFGSPFPSDVSRRRRSRGKISSSRGHRSWRSGRRERAAISNGGSVILCMDAYCSTYVVTKPKALLLLPSWPFQAGLQLRSSVVSYRLERSIHGERGPPLASPPMTSSSAVSSH